MSWSRAMIKVKDIQVSSQISVFLIPRPLSPPHCLSGDGLPMSYLFWATVFSLVKEENYWFWTKWWGDQWRLREWLLLFWHHRHHWTVYEEILTSNFFLCCYIALWFIIHVKDKSYLRAKGLCLRVLSTKSPLKETIWKLYYPFSFILGLFFPEIFLRDKNRKFGLFFTVLRKAEEPSVSVLYI